ncbi:MAG: hypothetical protein H8Z69_01995 [Nanohaloarchaea archaeon]|nr:hypothetical protein [Candidatus Nanohaloarchaea archaeon]
MIEVSDLPKNTRIKLSENDEERLWNKVEKESVTATAKKTDFSRTKLYNWRSKDCFIPLKFVNQLLNDFKVEALKAGSNAKPLKLKLPLEPSSELLTRISASASVNKEGTPVYRTQERSLLERFKELLEQLGEIPYKIYSRDAYELRYPKLLQEILKKQNYRTELAALFDEKGEFKNGKMLVNSTEIKVQDFKGELYSMDKKYRLAIERNDEKEMEEILKQSVQRFQPPSSD